MLSDFGLHLRAGERVGYAIGCDAYRPGWGKQEVQQLFRPSSLRVQDLRLASLALLILLLHQTMVSRDH